MFKKLVLGIVAVVLLVSVLFVRDNASADTLPPAWTVGARYYPGDLVSYMGDVYECIQEHTAFSHWNPGAPGLAALWFKPQNQICADCTYAWVAGVWFGEGDEVTYGNYTYRATADHVSDWSNSPDLDPELWDDITADTGTEYHTIITVSDPQGDLFRTHVAYEEAYNVDYYTECIPDAADIREVAIQIGEDQFTAKIRPHTGTEVLQETFNEYGNLLQFGFAFDSDLDGVSDVILLLTWENDQIVMKVLNPWLDELVYGSTIALINAGLSKPMARIEDGNWIMLSIPMTQLMSMLHLQTSVLSPTAVTAFSAFAITDSSNPPAQNPIIAPVVDMATISKLHSTTAVTSYNPQAVADPDPDPMEPTSFFVKTCPPPQGTARTFDVNGDGNSDWMLGRSDVNGHVTAQDWCLSTNPDRPNPGKNGDYIASLVFVDANSNGIFESGELGGWMDQGGFEGSKVVKYRFASNNHARFTSSATDDGYFDDKSDGVLDEYVYNYTLGGLLEFVHNKDGLGSAPVTISMPEAADNIPPQ